MLKAQDIERVYSETVESYFQKGYTLNVNTMAGCQGEICKVDLRKGNEIIRVLLTDSNYVRNDDDFEYFIALQTLRYESTSSRLRSRSTLWIEKGELIDELRFYEISSSKEVYTSDHEEYKRCKKLRWARMKAGAYDQNEYRVNLDPRKVLQVVRRLKGCKTTKLADIKYVVHTSYKGKCEYSIHLTNKTVRVGSIY